MTSLRHHFEANYDFSPYASKRTDEKRCRLVYLGVACVRPNKETRHSSRRRGNSVINPQEEEHQACILILQCITSSSTSNGSTYCCTPPAALPIHRKSEAISPQQPLSQIGLVLPMRFITITRIGVVTRRCRVKTGDQTIFGFRKS